MLARRIHLALAANLVVSGTSMATKANADVVHDAEEEGAASYKTEMVIAHAAPLGVMWATAIVSDGKSNGAYFTAFGLTLPPVILTPPIVHAWHANWGRSAASLGLNLVSVIPGWVTMWTFVLDPCDERGTRCDDHKFQKTAAVHTVFNGLAMLADIAMADIEPKRQATSARGAVVQPAVSTFSGGIMFGAQGVF